MTDLTAKFDALETSIGGKLDTVILRLDDIKTALTASGGSIEAAPIVAAIESLRGTGPENTIRSINQSLWNIAGPTPGKSLAEIYTLLTVNHAAIGVYLAAIGADTDATANALGIPTGDATTTLLGVMYSLQYALTHNLSGDPNLLSVVHAINNAVGGVPNNSIELASVRGLLNAIRISVAQTNNLLDPLSVTPTDICETPFVSSGIVYQALEFSIVMPVTIATWPNTGAPAGITIIEEVITGWSKVQAVNWDDWRVYVASEANFFAAEILTTKRFPTNEWVSLPHTNEILQFFTEGNSALTVYICASTELVGGTAPTGTDFTSSTSTSIAFGRRYVVWPDIEGLTESAGGVELAPVSSWDGYEVYIQTSAAAATLHDVTEPAQSIETLTVNTWNPLGANHTLSFSVDAAYLVKGYMRVPSGLSAIQVTVNGATEWAIVWPTGIDAINSLGGYTRSDRVYRVGDFYGWRALCITGSCYVDKWNGGTWLGELAIDNTEVTINHHTTHINFHSTSQFTLEFFEPL